MAMSRAGAELSAWGGGAVVGAAAGVALGALSSWQVGVGTAIVIGLLVALSIRRGRGGQGWADEDGESRLEEGRAEPGIPRSFVKSTGSPADLPVTPGMGAIGSGPTGIES